MFVCFTKPVYNAEYPLMVGSKLDFIMLVCSIVQGLLYRNFLAMISKKINHALGFRQRRKVELDYELD